MNNELISDWLGNSMQTEITIYSTSINGKKITKFLKQKEKEGFDRIETSLDSGMTMGQRKFKIKLVKLQPFNIGE